MIQTQPNADDPIYIYIKSVHIQDKQVWTSYKMNMSSKSSTEHSVGISINLTHPLSGHFFSYFFSYF